MLAATARMFYSLLARAMMLRVSQKRVSSVQIEVLSHTPVQLLPLSARLHLCTLQLLQNVLENFLKMLFWGAAVCNLMIVTTSFGGWKPHNDGCL